MLFIVIHLSQCTIIYTQWWSHTGVSGSAGAFRALRSGFSEVPVLSALPNNSYILKIHVIYLVYYDFKNITN